MSLTNQNDKFISVNTLMIGIDTLIACFMESEEKLTKPISDTSVIALQMVKEFIERTLSDPKNSVL